MTLAKELFVGDLRRSDGMWWTDRWKIGNNRNFWVNVFCKLTTLEFIRCESDYSAPLLS